jgi:hypothetical protein
MVAVGSFECDKPKKCPISWVMTEGKSMSPWPEPSMVIDDSNVFTSTSAS